jgi:hypothetical protein
MKTKFKINEEVIYKGRKWIVIRIIINKSGINYQIVNSPNWSTGYSSVPENKLQKTLLDKEEEEYLESVLKPFKDKVDCIEKSEFNNVEYINIDIKRDASIGLPNFPRDTMYNGMKINKNIR